MGTKASILDVRVALIILLTLLNSSPSAAREAASPVAARVNGAPITRAEIQLEIDRLLPMASYHGHVDEAGWNKVVDKAVRALTDRELICEAAKKRGLEVPEKTLKELEGAWIARAGSKKALEEWLQTRGFRPDEFREALRKERLAEMLTERVTAEIESRPAPSDADLRKYYEANREKFVVPTSVDVQHILIRVEPWQPQAEWNAAEARAAAIAKRARAGENFDDLVRNFSDDAESKGAGGRLQSVHEGRFAAPIERLVPDMEPGEIGGPVRSLYGFNIVKLLARRPARQLAFDEVDRERLRSDLERKAVEDQTDAWREGLREKAQISLDETQIDLIRQQGGNPPSASAQGLPNGE